MSLNVSKTKVMVFRKNYLTSNSSEFLLDNVKINLVTSTKFLGVEVNSDLSWSDHINSVSNKIARAIGVIARIRHKLTRRSLILLYDTLIASLLSYCNIIWASTYRTPLLKIYSLQKRALKLCTGKLT